MENAKTVAIAELLIAISARVYATSHAHGLTPAQWSALRYFATANAGAANLASFVVHHGTTKGTASRTVTRLVQRGLLVRTQDGIDKRRQIVQVTPKGQTLLEQDPAHLIAASIKESEIGDLDDFVHTLLKIVGAV